MLAWLHRVDASVSHPIASELASFRQALHRIAYGISVILHGWRD